jgi:lipopolysaccharide biosynthesis glycosyltransferase
MKIFICTNDNQAIGAKVSKQAFLNRSSFKDYDIEIIHESDFPELKRFFSLPYKRKGKMTDHEKNDMQSFTLLRFIIPELMNYQGRALVVDPDVFLVRNGLEQMLNLSLEKHAIYARKGLKKSSWGSSVMLLNCLKLSHWKLTNFIEQMHSGKLDYDDLINLKLEDGKIGELESKWNEFDIIKENTILLHTTEKITQPWRTGLELNSLITPLFYIFPRAPIYKLFGKDLTIGRNHPQKSVTHFFMRELSNCLVDGVITNYEIDQAVENNFLRPDIYLELEKFKKK